MLQAFYTATVGAQQQMERMGVQGNNMANANTFGFRAEKPAFEALMYRMVDGIDGQQLPKGSGTRMVSTISDFRSAALEETGRKQDYAIVGDGFFALYDPDTGEISYTRDGSFALSSFQQTKEDGTTDTLYYLADGEGRQVLDTNGYPIVVTDAEARQPVGVFTIQYLDGLQHVGSGRFVTTEKNGAVWMSPSEVRQGYLESSNVDLASEMGKVIEAQRTYSYVLRMMQTADEIETTVNNLTNG